MEAVPTIMIRTSLDIYKYKNVQPEKLDDPDDLDFSVWDDGPIKLTGVVANRIIMKGRTFTDFGSRG